MTKVQIRRGLFETNSSSIHTLTVVSKLPEGTILPDHIYFGKGPDEYSDWKKLKIEEAKKSGQTLDSFSWLLEKDVYTDPIQEKIDVVYNTILESATYDVAEFFQRIEYVKGIFGKLGITCEFNMNPDTIGPVRELTTSDLLDNLFTQEDDCLIVNYIFGGEDSFFDSREDYLDPVECPPNNITWSEHS